jgi:glycosyltransferase involved in cell wall biosynthesis
MTSKALVGVVIPTLDGERYLGEAIESVLRQTHQRLDVVVVDNGSTDATRDVARTYAPDVRCVALPHRGLGAARNVGVRAVRGDHVAFLDQDDVWADRKLELQLAQFGEPTPPDLVFGHAREFISPEHEPRLANRIRCVIDLRPAALPGTMLASRASIAKVGPFSTRWATNDFMAWLLAARRIGLREVMLADHVLSRRLHDSNFSHRADVTRAEYLHVLKESLDRRRADAGKHPRRPLGEVVEQAT